MSLSVASLVQTTTRELLDLTNVPKSARLDRLRATINQAKRKLVVFQRELTNLKSAELLVIQKMNRYEKLEDIEKYYPSDRFMVNEPKPGIKPVEDYGFPDPDPRINWTRNRLLEGLAPLEAERNRIANEIKSVSQQIMKEREALTQAQKELGSESDVALSKDAIAKRTYSELYMLYEIHRKYREITTNSDGSRRYNSDTTIVKFQQELSTKFKAYAERNAYVVNGDMVLNYDDPGSDENEKTLLNMINRCFSVLGNQTNVNLNDEPRQKNTNRMIGSMNDPFISNQVLRQDDAKKPEPDKALKNNTETTSKLVSFVNKVVDQGGLKINMNWDQTSAFNAFNTWFEKQVTGLNQGMPLCSPSPETSGDQEKKATAEAQSQADSSAAALIAREFAQTQKVIDIAVIDATLDNLMADLNVSIQDPTGKGTSASSSLIIGQTEYEAFCLYQVRILNNTSKVANYLMDMKAGSSQATVPVTQGNLTEDQYQSRITRLTSTITGPEVNPALYVWTVRQ